MLRRAEVVADSDVKALADAIWTHKLVIVKGQQHIRPIKQWELVTRFDPKAPLVHSHGDVKTFNKQGGLLSVCLISRYWQVNLLTRLLARTGRLWYTWR
jgi:hypothetical protein